MVNSLENNCHMASVNPEFSITLSQHLNQSCLSAVLQLILVVISSAPASEFSYRCSI